MQSSQARIRFAAFALLPALAFAGLLPAASAKGDQPAIERRAVFPMLVRETADAPGVTVRRAGEYVAGFEHSEFRPCEGARWSPAWLLSEDPTFSARYDELVKEAGANPLEGMTVYVVVDARIELAIPGQLGFGHLGHYRAELTVERLIEMRPRGCDGTEGSTP